MNTQITPGALVEVHQVGPLPFWSNGYRFARYENERTCMVTHVTPPFDGLEVRYPAEAVRREQPRKVGDRVIRVEWNHGPGTVEAIHGAERTCERCTRGPHAVVRWEDTTELCDEDPADLTIFDAAPPPVGATLEAQVHITEEVVAELVQEERATMAARRRDVHTGRTWLEFPSKPDKITREALGLAGWRFSGLRQQWHHPQKHAAPPAGIKFYDDGTVTFSEERPERTRKAAAAARAEAESCFKREHAIGSGIPMGQPILVGHHSEKRHRRDIERMQNLATRGVEAYKAGEALADRAASSERLLERRQTDPGLIERRLGRLRPVLKRMEAYALEHDGNVPDDYVRRLSGLRDEITENERHLAELRAVEPAADAPPAVGDVIKLRNMPFLVGRVNHRTFSGWTVFGGADAWPGKIDKTHFDGTIYCRGNEKLLAAVAHRTALKGYYGDEKWRKLTSEGIDEATKGKGVP